MKEIIKDTDIFKKLDSLIEQILELHKNISYKWQKTGNPSLVNLKKTCITNIKNDDTLLNLVWKYQDFITLAEEILSFIFSLSESDQVVNTRIKTKNSIEYKIEHYFLYHENGHIPINKCLNDLFGIRVILSGKFSHADILKHIIEQYPKLRCIDSSKADYIATHVYFKSDNFSFPWELQIWKTEDRNKNLNSHRKYKQEYTHWEEESKGGF